MDSKEERNTKQRRCAHHTWLPLGQSRAYTKIRVSFHSKNIGGRGLFARGVCQMVGANITPPSSICNAVVTTFENSTWWPGSLPMFELVYDRRWHARRSNQKETYSCSRFRVLHHRKLHEHHHSDIRFRIPSQRTFSSLLSTTSTYSMNCLVSLRDV